MARVHEVRLELVRPGPPHNQLLSPLTPYMALCGEGSPITFHIDFEHRQLLNRLERLRYVSADANGRFVRIPERLREAQVQELGEEMGRLLSRIPSLITELVPVRSMEAQGSDFVHLRLVLSGSELAILPFELARAPQAFPGEGLDFCLQGSLPIVVTRETRRSRPPTAAWGARDPKILFVFAELPGLTVPKREHLRALRDALDPWIEWPEIPTGGSNGKSEVDRRLPLVKDRLRVIADASVEDIYRLCSEESFTHVHILAHGDTYSEAGEERFGVALHRHGRRQEKHVVGGKQLAQALRAEGSDGTTRSEPLVVSVAICDSGQQGSVLVPGGSIAHDLHTEGIPWVFASQFPLTKKGSVRIAEFLYPRLMRGDDPRQVLYELRRALAMTASGEHDWASIVTYASVEPDMDDHVTTFFANQTIKAIEVQMSRVDKLVATIRAQPSDRTAVGPDTEITTTAIKKGLDEVRVQLERWQRRMPVGERLRDRTTRTNCFGMQGSTLKRIGLLHAALGKQPEANAALQAALGAYRKAMDEWVTDEARFNWTASQYLALSAVLKPKADAGDLGTYAVCRRLAERDLDHPDKALRTWAHGTLAELELLGSFYGRKPPEDLMKSVLDHCQEIVALMGANSFEAQSTRRQFERYVRRWELADWPHDEDWRVVAQAAVKALSSDA